LKNSGDFLSTSVAKNPLKIKVSSDEDDQNEFLYYSNEKESNILSLNMIEAVGHSGNVAVRYQLGCLYGDTESDDRDYSKAAYWFGLASQGGITDAYYRLGRLYEEGQGVEKSYLQLFTLYQKAADKDHDMALYRLAQMYQCGLGTPIDFNKAFTFYKKSAEQDNEIGKKVVTFLKSSLHDSSQTTSDEISDLSSSEINDIIYMYEDVANVGNTDIQFELGYYFESKQLEPDYTRAAKWYLMAKDLGHIDATYCLGRLYELGLGVNQDYVYAFELYTIAKKGGLSEATFRLGNMYQSGFGVKVDYQQAFGCYTEASEQGNLDAQFKLGQMYAQGIFKSKNTLEALKWFTRSYLQGNDTVRESLYLLYDGDEPYESIFYCRMAKILRSYAKNEDYHMEEGPASRSEVYARLFHAYLNGQGVQKNSEFAWHYLTTAVKLNTYIYTIIFDESVFHFIKDNISEIYNMALTQLENGDESACVILGTLYLGGVILLEETKEGGKKIYSSVFEDIFDLSDNSLYDENLAIGTVIVPKDYKKALQYFSKAANAGDSYSKLVVGFMYHCGYGAEQNFTKAFEYYQNLSSPGQFGYAVRNCLGYLYAFGEGVDRDNDMVVKYSTVDGIFRTHFLVIAQIFYYGNEEIRNYKTALKFLLMAESARSFNGLHLIKKANEHDLNGQSNLINKVYSLVSKEVVDGEIKYLLGIMYENGQGTRVNYKEAFDKFSKAVKRGNRMAENHLKLYYKDGKFINKNS
jgi:TPR repeat protein